MIFFFISLPEFQHFGRLESQAFGQRKIVEFVRLNVESVPSDKTKSFLQPQRINWRHSFFLQTKERNKTQNFIASNRFYGIQRLPRASQIITALANKGE